MARVEINEIIAMSNTGQGIDGALVTVTKTDTTAASVYAAQTGGSPLTQPLQTSNGRIAVWVDEGSYILTVVPSPSSLQFDPQVIQIEAVSGNSVIASRAAEVVGVLYTGAAPARPNVGGAFVIWNGNTDPGSNAIEGDLGIGWTP